MATVLSLPEAIAANLRDGDKVAMEGFTHLIPYAAGHEAIRQGRTDLTLIRMTPDLLYDQMIGCGLAKRLVFSWGGNPGVGSLHRLRDAVERGWPRPIELDEHSHAAMANAYAAGAASFPEERWLWSTVGFTVALSVVLHGILATPVMRRLDALREAAGRNTGARRGDPAPH